MNRITTIFCWFFLIASTAFSQEPVTTSVTKDLDQYRVKRLQEKLFVHTDKDVYLAGEICWFKIYSVDAASHQPLDLSKVVYLEWLDAANKPVLQAKAGMDKGMGDASVYLPLTMRTGNYKLRVYTSWMKNFGADWFFEKQVTVINTRRSAETPAAPQGPQYTVNFFPEGGNLVDNVPGKVAFRIADEYGRGAQCTGVITEDEGDTVVKTGTWRFGMGSFVFTPRPGHHYRSIFRLEDGTAINTLLPAAAKDGLVMNVVPEGKDQLRINLQSTTDGGTFYLVAHTRQSVRQAMGTTLRSGKASFLVGRDMLGEGISHLTIFDAAREPVCERLVFKQPARTMHLDVQADKTSYATREKVTLQVKAEDQLHRPMDANCSLAVFLSDSLQQVTPDHILPYLLLASDLKGKIESPDYYFDHPEDEQAMDNLMMTNGWRRFRWNEVLHHTAPAFDFPPEFNGSIISGKMIDTKTGGPAPKMILAYLSVPGTRTQFTVARPDDDGKIRFELKDFYGSQEMIVQTNPLDSQYKVEIGNPFAEEYTRTPILPYFVPSQFGSQLTDRNTAMQVLNRYGGVRLKQFHVPIADTAGFFYHADYSYLLDNYVRFTTMEEVLREYVQLILVQRRHGHYHIPVYDLSFDRGTFENDPLTLLDGVPVFDLDKLLALDPLKIRKLETVQRRYFLGTATFEGIMNWTTYKGDLAGYIIDPHAVVVDYPGLELQREFYSPTYATPEDKGSHLPDFRNVLYLAPTVSTGSGDQKPLSFYSSDIPGKYLIVVEGLAKDGTPGTALAGFEVK